jgi:tetratricopeptide (TPR) repeat protein
MIHKALSTLILILVAASLTYPQGDTSFDKGIADLIDSGRYKEAISKLQSRLKSLKDEELIADTFFQIGDIYYKYLHDYPKALDTYRRIERLNDNDPGQTYVTLARMLEAEVLCRTGKFDQAIGIYRDISESYPPGTLYRRVARQKYLNVQNALENLKEQRRIIGRVKNTPLEIQARLQAAELFKSDLNQPEKAIEEYRLIADRFPTSPAAPEALWWIGYLYASLNMPQKAISAYREVIERYPASKFDAEAYFQMGRLYMSIGDYGKAAATFERLISTRPAFWKLPAAFYWLGVCYERMDEYDEAIDSLRSFTNVYLNRQEHIVWAGDIGKHSEPKLKIETEVTARIRQLELKLPESLWRRASRAMKENRFSEAAGLLRKLVSLFPDSSYSGKAVSMLPRTEMMAEVQECRRIIERNPGSVVSAIAHFRIAELYENGLSDYKRAIKEYQAVVRGEDDLWRARALYRMGMIYQEKLGRYEEAVRVFRRITDEFPKTEYAMMAYYQMGELYRKRLNRHKDALVAYAETASYPPHTRYLGDGFVDSLVDAANFRIGRTYFENLHDMKGALKVFREFVKSNPRSPRLAAAYVFIGMIYERQGEMKAAIEEYRRAVNKVLESPIQAKMLKEEVTELNLQTGDQAESARRIMDRINAIRMDLSRTMPRRTPGR